MDSLKTSSPQEAKLHFLDYWRIIRIRKTVILAVFLLVVITATVATVIFGCPSFLQIELGILHHFSEQHLGLHDL